MKTVHVLDLLIEAFGLAKDRLPERTRLVIAGRCFEPWVKYQTQIDVLGISARVDVDRRYVPFSEMFERLSDAAVVVHPYRQGTQSASIVLAFSLGIPVIASDSGGLPEQVQDGINGYIFPSGDVRALASALTRVFQDSDRLDAMRRAALKTSETAMNWARICEKHLRVYKKR